MRALRATSVAPAATATPPPCAGAPLTTLSGLRRYLRRHGLSADTLKTSAWVEKDSDKVAAAILDWAKDNGASVYCHWFQPMGSSGFRFGQTGQVYNTMLEFDGKGTPQWKVRPPRGTGGEGPNRNADPRGAPAPRHPLSWLSRALFAFHSAHSRPRLRRTNQAGPGLAPAGLPRPGCYGGDSQSRAQPALTASGRQFRCLVE
jgi:hypothetical protein